MLSIKTVYLVIKFMKKIRYFCYFKISGLFRRLYVAVDIYDRGGEYVAEIRFALSLARFFVFIAVVKTMF